MLPLEGLRVLAVEQYGAGPFGSTYLADLGAEVIKIENPGEGGELGRRVGPFFLGPGDSHFYQCFNRNKRSVRLDLKSDAGQEVLRDLAATCEAVFGNLRGDQPEKLGLTHAQLRDRNRAIVCVHLSAYGRTGERGAWPGFDFLMQAEAGHLHLTGPPDGPPERYGISVVDYMTGLTAAFALVTGVLEARARGIGRDYDVSLLDVARYNLGYQAAWYLNEGYVPARLPRSAHASIVPCQLYRTGDGWIFIMCNKEKFWGKLACAVGRAQWEHDPRFETFAARLEHRMLGDELSGVVDPQLLGESVHFHGASGEAVRDRVLVALDTDHAVARQPPLQAKHRRVRMSRQLLERLSLLGERHVDPPSGGAVHAPVRDRLAPLPEPGVQSVQVGELGAQEEVLAHVPEHPLDLALGLRPVRRARPGPEPEVAGHVEQRRVIAHQAIVVLAQHRGLHPVVQHLAGNAPQLGKRLEVTANHGCAGPGGARTARTRTGCSRAPARTATRPGPGPAPR